MFQRLMVQKRHSHVVSSDGTWLQTQVQTPAVVCSVIVLNELGYFSASYTWIFKAGCMNENICRLIVEGGRTNIILSS